MVRLHLDDASKMVVCRFGLKLAVVLFLIGLTHQNLPTVLCGASFILCLHAARSALILKECPLMAVLGYWDEAVWFLTLATAANLVQRYWGYSLTGV
jgi:hypothetical protein